ncbi:MarR family winged helix-turn-helix transcriptional regulator [Paeniglutamicibacter sp. R2-26]|uniref:MarR family winged helix-turn-helix transcriptional regulator n=1 Tax=Paeniglutamicibacter sp. R2-26 TaxID=3144417 RepID=UPI003EE74C1C
MTRVPPDDGFAPHPASRLLQEVLVLNDALEHAICRHLDINATDFQALRHLIRLLSLTPSELAAHLRISTAATTAVIDRMTKRGHVLRTPHPSDRRSFLLSPSPAALAQTLAALDPLFNAAEQLTLAMSPEDERAVVRYLDGVRGAMHGQIEAMENATTGNRKG